MALLRSQRLGPYEILSAVGAGGMGEVYRARDTRLERTVPVKILRDHLSDRAALRERFEREARTVASLNHPHLRTEFDESQGQFSPDGRWVAYASDESGRPEVYVQPFPGPGPKIQISTAGGIQPRWRRDGKELFYRVDVTGKMMAVRSRPMDSSRQGCLNCCPWKRLRVTGC